MQTLLTASKGGYPNSSVDATRPALGTARKFRIPGCSCIARGLGGMGVGGHIKDPGRSLSCQAVCKVLELVAVLEQVEVFVPGDAAGNGGLGNG